jgi:LCP family protein required for cell wall assembly
MKIVLRIGMVVLIAAIAVAGYGFYQYNHMIKRWYEPLPGSGESAGENDAKQPVEKKLPIANIEPFTLMIVGVDSRGEAKARSDTMMVAAVNPGRKEVFLFSIPRDTYAYIPGYGYDKFNHAMFYGGPDLLKKTIESFFGFEINHYVTVDFEGFKKIIDELGGIEIDVKRRMLYHDPSDGTVIDIKPGRQIMDGETALDYARFRMSDNGVHDSDFERIKRQQEVIRQVIDKGNDITALPKIFTIMDVLGEHVRTDLTERQIRGLYLKMHNLSPDDLHTTSLAGTSKRMWAHGYSLWFYVVSDEEKQRVRQQVQSYLTTEPAAK